MIHNCSPPIPIECNLYINSIYLVNKKSDVIYIIIVLQKGIQISINPLILSFSFFYLQLLFDTRWQRNFELKMFMPVKSLSVVTLLGLAFAAPQFTPNDNLDSLRCVC